MSRFEYMSVLISIVLALGLTEVLVCWARLIQHRAEVHFSWLHGFWSAFVVILMVQFWWGFWNFNVIETWRFLYLLAIIFETMLVVIAAMLLTPGRAIQPGLDLEKLYFANARPFFLVGVMMIACLSLVDTLILDLPLLSAENLVRGIAILLLASMTFVTSRRMHILAAGLFASMLLLFMVIAEFQ